MKPFIHCTHNIYDIIHHNFAGWNLQILCHEGSCRFLYANRLFSFQKGCDVIITSPEHFDIIEASDDLCVDIVIGLADFVNSRLPSNHFGIGGALSVFENPVVRLDENGLEIMSMDFKRVFERVEDTDNPFYADLMGSLVLTLVYDSYLFLSRRDAATDAGIYTSSLVDRLMKLLQSGLTKTHRSVGYYAERLNVTQKYLSDTIRRQTGESVTTLIDRHFMPLLSDSLRNSRMSLSQIAYEFNFSSISYLSRYIKKHYGITATEYRSSLQPNMHNSEIYMTPHAIPTISTSKSAEK